MNNQQQQQQNIHLQSQQQFSPQQLQQQQYPQQFQQQYQQGEQYPQPQQPNLIGQIQFHNFQKGQQQIIYSTIFVQQQPLLSQQQPQQFINPLFGCTKDCPFCLVSGLCCCILYYHHAQAIDRASKGITSCFLACLLDLIGCGCLNRQTLRKSYNIEGNLTEDCVTMCFCQFCGMMQNYYEAQIRG